MKKILTAALCCATLCATLSLSACGSKDDGKPDPGPTDHTVTVSTADAFNNYFEIYSNAQPSQPYNYGTEAAPQMGTRATTMIMVNPALSGFVEYSGTVTLKAEFTPESDGETRNANILADRVITLSSWGMAANTFKVDSQTENDATNTFQGVEYSVKSADVSIKFNHSGASGIEGLQYKTLTINDRNAPVYFDIYIEGREFWTDDATPVQKTRVTVSARSYAADCAEFKDVKLKLSNNKEIKLNAAGEGELEYEIDYIEDFYRSEEKNATHIAGGSGTVDIYPSTIQSYGQYVSLMKEAGKEIEVPDVEATSTVKIDTADKFLGFFSWGSGGIYYEDNFEGYHDFGEDVIGTYNKNTLYVRPDLSGITTYSGTVTFKAVTEEEDVPAALLVDRTVTLDSMGYGIHSVTVENREEQYDYSLNFGDCRISYEVKSVNIDVTVHNNGLSSDENARYVEVPLTMANAAAYAMVVGQMDAELVFDEANPGNPPTMEYFYKYEAETQVEGFVMFKDAKATFADGTEITLGANGYAYKESAHTTTMPDVPALLPTAVSGSVLFFPNGVDD